jgi:hypothetical protein
MLLTWYRKLAHPASHAPRPRRRPAARRPAPRRLQLEALENRLAPANVGTESLIQSDWAGGGHGHLEAVVLEGNNLVHYWRDENFAWHFGELITANATGPGSIIQSSQVGLLGHGYYEVVVPEGNRLQHYRNNNVNWYLSDTVTFSATGPGSIIQSDWGHLEAVALEGSNLVHYWQDGSLVWHFDAVITASATGPGSIIQSDYVGLLGHGYYEVVVPEGSRLQHYRNDNVNWYFSDTVTYSATGPGSIIQSDWTDPNDVHGHLEVAVPEGSNLVHYWGNLQGGIFNWHFDAPITTNAFGPGSLIQSDYINGTGHRNYEVVATDFNFFFPDVDHYYNDGTGWYYGAFISNNV